MSRLLAAGCFVVAINVLIACNGRGQNGAMPLGNSAAILLFNGTGTSPNDVAAVETILQNEHLSYSTADAGQLNNIGVLELARYRLLLIPGGNFIDIGNSLNPTTILNIRNAVNNGLNYLDICAGGFLAGSSVHYKSFALVTGIQFGFYLAGAHKAVVPITRPGFEIQEHYWEDGPQFTGWGTTVAKYPDGTPAIAQGAFGKGWVVLAGIHAEAPAAWRRGMAFKTPVETDNAYAATLLRAALNHQLLPHY